MIQRIQSLYLIIASIVLLVLFLFDAVWPGGYTDVPSWLPLAMVICCLLAIGSAIWALLLYRDRNRQHKVVLYAQIFTIAAIVVLLVGLWQVGELSPMLGEPGGTTKLIAVLLPFVSYVLLFLARKAIERDIELVRSIDRLR